MDSDKQQLELTLTQSEQLVLLLLVHGNRPTTDSELQRAVDLTTRIGAAQPVLESLIAKGLIRPMYVHTDAGRAAALGLNVKQSAKAQP